MIVRGPCDPRSPTQSAIRSLSTKADYNYKDVNIDSNECIIVKCVNILHCIEI